jgi:hypothetical protein
MNLRSGQAIRGNKIAVKIIYKTGNKCVCMCVRESARVVWDEIQLTVAASVGCSRCRKVSVFPPTGVFALATEVAGGKSRSILATTS